MKHRQQPSDEEIQSYMNFDRLLDSRKIAVENTSINAIWKWGIPAVMVSLLAVWLFITKDSTHPVADQSPQPNAAPYPENVAPAEPLDSVNKKDAVVNEDARNMQQKLIPHKETGPLAEKSITEENPKLDANEMGYTQAEPRNGYADLYDYFNSNLVYPLEALKDSIQGVQTISFIINAKGVAEQIQITKSLGEPFEKEAKRLIENMPEWKPATLNGKPVASKISLPLTFQMQKIKK